MEIQSIVMQREKLMELASSNPKFLKWLEDKTIDYYIKIDDDRALFQIQERPNFYGKPCYYKYVVEKAIDEETGMLQAVPINPNLQEFVLRGMQNQFNLRKVLGVQYIGKTTFVDNIVGLIGPLELIEGYNLRDTEVVNRNLPSLEDKLKIIAFFETVIRRMHKAGYEHRDIKDGNLVVGFNGPSRIIDFSTSCSFLEHELDIKSGKLIGSFGFFDKDSEEKRERDRDYLALGVVLANLLLPGESELLALRERTKKGLPLNDYEARNYSLLKEKFGVKIADYFKFLMTRPWPYKSEQFLNVVVLEEGLERRSYRVGRDTFSFDCSKTLTSW